MNAKSILYIFSFLVNELHNYLLKQSKDLSWVRVPYGWKNQIWFDFYHKTRIKMHSIEDYKKNHWIIDFHMLKCIPGFWCIFCAKHGSSQLYWPSNRELAISNLEISEGNGSSKPLNNIKNDITVVKE